MLLTVRRALPVLATAFGCLLIAQTSTSAQLANAQPTAEQMIDALKLKSSRGLSTGETKQPVASAADDALIQDLVNKASRGLSVSERTTLADAVEKRPAFDLEVNFEFNSAAISQSAMPVLMTLGKAMQSEDLKGGKFLLAGHTDAKGKPTYNHTLSEQRSDAVRAFLMSNFNLTAEKLVAIGYGQERLKNTQNPYADENRRVQVVNISPAVASSKP